MKLNPSGLSASIVNPRASAPPPKRTANKGWTKHAALRNRKFLYSVNATRLTGFPYAVTHTVADCPPSPEIWAYWVTQYFRYIGRNWPLVRWHCVTEMQLRGVPHLHAILYFLGRGGVWSGSPERAALTQPGAARDGIILGRDIPTPHQLIEIWAHIACLGGPQPWAQDVKQLEPNCIPRFVGYLDKHASRGVNNAQRNPENMPDSWEGRSCRVWRKGGDWPIETPILVHGLTKEQDYQIRRVFCRYLASCPPSQQVPASERAQVQRFWRNFLKCDRAVKSRMRAPSSFMKIETQIQLVKSVAPDAWFSDELTGEVFHSVEDLPMDRPSPWVAPTYAFAPTDMADLL